MKLKSPATRKSHGAALCALLFLAILNLCGCGGGSAGTDSGGKNNYGAEFHGTLIDESGATISGATVTLVQTGQRAQSNEQGRFQLKTDFVGEGAVLEVSSGNEEGRVEIDFNLTENSVVTLTISLLENSTLIIASQTITDRPSVSGQTSPSPTATINSPVGMRPSTPPSTQQPSATTAMPSIFRGTVRYAIGTPVVGARVTISESNDSTVTASDGSFSLERPTRKGKATLTVSIYNIPLSVEIKEIPDHSIFCTVELVVSFPNSQTPSNVGEFSPELSFGKITKRARKW